jgi:hypothetical protein
MTSVEQGLFCAQVYNERFQEVSMEIKQGGSYFWADNDARTPHKLTIRPCKVIGISEKDTVSIMTSDNGRFIVYKSMLFLRVTIEPMGVE